MVKRVTKEFMEDEIELDIFDANTNNKKRLSEDSAVGDWYKAFRNTKIDAQRMKNFVSNWFEVSLSDVGATIVATATKIFIGEVVEEARRIKTKLKQNGPI